MLGFAVASRAQCRETAVSNIEAYSVRVPADYVGQVLNGECRRTMADTRMNDYCKGGGEAQPAVPNVEVRVQALAADTCFSFPARPATRLAIAAGGRTAEAWCEEGACPLDCALHCFLFRGL